MNAFLVSYIINAITFSRCFQLLDLCIRSLHLKRLLDFRCVYFGIINVFIMHLSFPVSRLQLHSDAFFLQALVQFSDAETATSAKDALDGRSIPR